MGLVEARKKMMTWTYDDTLMDSTNRELVFWYETIHKLYDSVDIINGIAINERLISRYLLIAHN